MKLTFAGAAGTDTGSRYLVDHDQQRLHIDGGLFQGYKMLRLGNWAPFPVPPAAIHGVVMIHAHLDHSGYLPVLVRLSRADDTALHPCGHGQPRWAHPRNR